MEGVTMKEYKLQCHIMTAKGVKATDRFIMLCIAKSVDWSTWSRDIAMSAIYKKYDIPVATFSRSIKALKALGWINVVSNRTGLKQHHTTITVYPNVIMQHETTVDQNDKAVDQNDKPTVDQNDKLVDQNDKAVDQIDKLVDQNDKPTVDQNDKAVDQIDKAVDQNDKAVDQNEVYNNIYNNNNINNQADEPIKYVSRMEAIVYTNNFHPRDLRHLADDRDKVPLHILNAKNKRLEIERRVAVVEEARGSKMGHHERLNFDGSQRDEDAKIYHAHSFEFKNIRKVW
jgi:hypothetical protein